MFTTGIVKVKLDNKLTEGIVIRESGQYKSVWFPFADKTKAASAGKALSNLNVQHRNAGSIAEILNCTFTDKHKDIVKVSERTFANADTVQDVMKLVLANRKIPRK